MAEDPARPARATVLLTPDGVVTGWSDGAARLFGPGAAAAAGAALTDLLGGPARPSSCWSR
ncbi:hypothetical protein ACFQY7_10160 [Actinomadura luteofluorescens]|uniref:hypothetical protein n=1 Tax=Actinomadura luteofluorescens TaxID=46163 RepID=UPI0036272BDB